MNKIICYLFLVGCFNGNHLSGKTKSPVVKGYAFFMVPTPGIIRVDENGRSLPRKIDTVFTVYAETNANPFQWERAWLNGKSFSLVPSLMKTKKVEIGEERKEGRKIILTVAKNDSLWQLQLSDDKKNEKAPQQLSAGEVLIKGKQGNQAFFYRIKSLEELASQLYQ